jgi:hypothetical protein
MPLADRKLIVTSLATSNGVEKCGSGRTAARDGSVLSLGDFARASEANAFLSTAGTQVGWGKPQGKTTEPLTPPSLKIEDPALREQIIRAVFARVAALSKGDAAGRLALQQEVSGGYAMVASFDARLRFYEAHRDQFATLADFLPQLLASAAKTPAKAVAADAEPKTGSGQCAIQVAAVAPESLGAPSGGQ